MEDGEYVCFRHNEVCKSSITYPLHIFEFPSVRILNKTCIIFLGQYMF